MSEQVKEIISFLRDAKHVIVLAGAGMSADSTYKGRKLPTFRNNDGFWKEYPGLQEKGLSFEKIANPGGYLANPELGLGFYGHRLNMYKDAVIHKGYELLSQYAHSRPGKHFFITTNVDGHGESFFDNFQEEHGSIHDWQCSNRHCAKETGVIPAPEFDVSIQEFSVELEDRYKCQECGSVIRPNIVMFYDFDYLDSKINNSERIMNQKLYQLIERNGGDKVAIIEIGAGNKIATLQAKADDLRSQLPNSKYIRINPEEGVFSPDFHIKMGALEAIEALLGAKTLIRESFIERMAQELDENSHKGDWSTWTPDRDSGASEIEHHLNKLRSALSEGDKSKVSEYSADIANIAMKVSEIHGES